MLACFTCSSAKADFLFFFLLLKTGPVQASILFFLSWIWDFLGIELNGRLMCLVQEVHCTCMTANCKTHFALPFNKSVISCFSTSIVQASSYSSLKPVFLSWVVQNFISMSCSWSVSQWLKSSMQNQNKLWVVASGRCVARLKNKKSFFSFPPLPRSVSQWEWEQCRHFSLFEMRRCVQLRSDSLSRSEYSTAWRHMLACFVTRIVFSSLWLYLFHTWMWLQLSVALLYWECFTW